MEKAEIKSKKKSFKRENPKNLLIVSFIVGFLALMQNKYGFGSDIRSFYALHFLDGQHAWPFSEKIVMGTDIVQNPVEYPALTGLIMWLLTFPISPSPTDFYSYYRLTAIFNLILLSASSYLIYRLASRKYAYYFALAPAVLYALNRNWDIWAVTTMLLAILLFERQKYSLSAILLSISVATKFFPIVLMLPIMIIFLRNKQLYEFLKYGFTTLTTWILINLPFIFINFEGWLYFYKFSAERALGSASIYELTTILFPSIRFSLLHFYLLNFTVFLVVTIFLLKLKQIPTLAQISFFVLFTFILFNKQYSMQYVIWLTALSVVSLSFAPRKSRENLTYLYFAWQMFEIIFQYAFFQKLLTDKYADSETPMTIAVSANTYASLGVVRYLLAVIFTVLLAKSLYKANLSQLNETHRSKV
jgi:uncharacterized membrane protein